MITDEQARASLDRLRVACDQLCEEEDQYEEVRIGRLIEHETDILVEFASQELSRREAERVERAKPIDVDWLESIGFDFNGLRIRMLMSIGHYELSFSPTGGDLLLMQDDDAIAIPHITTRGQLLDLLAALNGGAT